MDSDKDLVFVRPSGLGDHFTKVKVVGIDDAQEASDTVSSFLEKGLLAFDVKGINPDTGRAINIADVLNESPTDAGAIVRQFGIVGASSAASSGFFSPFMLMLLVVVLVAGGALFFFFRNGA